MGQNFAAGMSGGVAYVLDLEEMLGSEKFISTTVQGCIEKEGAIAEWLQKQFRWNVKVLLRISQVHLRKLCNASGVHLEKIEEEEDTVDVWRYHPMDLSCHLFFQTTLTLKA